MGVSRPRAPLGARYACICTCRWIHAWVPRVEAGMYYGVRSWRKRPMLSCLTSDQRADQGGAVSLGPGDVSCARVCTCWCCGRGSNAKRRGVVGRMRVDSGAVQCHVLMRARVGVRVGSHPRPAIHMRKKEASRCKV